MKKISAFLLTVLMTLTLCSCGEKFNEEDAFTNLKDYVISELETGNYYLQVSKTSAGKQVVTEASKYGDDKAFLSYDAMGTITFFRNDKLFEVSAENAYKPKESDSSWDKYPYGKTGEKYYEALKTVCSTDFGKQVVPAFPKLTVTDSGNENYPYKISAYCNMDKMNAKALFNSGANFGIISIKFLSDESGKNFEDISLHVQYDFNDEIYVIAARFGDPALPDADGNNGQRPEDIEEIYNGYLASLQKSFQEYLESIQQNIAVEQE